MHVMVRLPYFLGATISRMRWLARHALSAATVVVALTTVGAGAAPADTRLLDCSVFPVDATAARLVARFGREQVADGAVEVGEGESEPGTIVFPDSGDSKVEIIWHDAVGRSRPQRVFVRTAASRWRSATGLRIGLDLQRVERINRKPFRLLGFGWDYGGTVSSWSGGALDHDRDAPCYVSAAFNPAASDATDRMSIEAQVLGEREFSSGHPAMQALNPVVVELTLMYRR
jgi:hypothetical protein